jgi:bacillithiol synthase
MQSYTVNRKEIPFLSELQNKIAYEQESLKAFINEPFSEDAFTESIAVRKKQFPKKNREYLVRIIKEQYSSLPTTAPSTIDLLSEENTFTVTTGHQLNLFTGPLYFFYKIAHTIKLAQELKIKHPSCKFIPIYWLASEDHDFEEINHFSIFNQRVEWQTNQVGPVGTFELENWTKWQDELMALFPNEKEKIAHLCSIYTGDNLAEATRNLVNYFFGSHGLVCVDGNHGELKKLFRKTMVKDVLSSFSEIAVKKTNEQLIEFSINPQVFPRPINLFFMEKDCRERLIPINGKISIKGKGEFLPMEIVALLEKRPELFSPNVVLRPVYQETILPNLAYIGGGGELAYWLQLKGVFDALELPFPLLNLRNSFQFIDSSMQKKMNQLGFDFSDFFKDKEELKKEYVLKNTVTELDFSAVDLLTQQIEEDLSKKASVIDHSLNGFVGSEMTRVKKAIDSIQKRLLKAEKQKFENELNRIDKLYSQLFPNNGLQERHENFLSMYFKFGDEFVNQLIDLSEPFQMDFKVICE